jgi:hypothetical protein
MHRRGLRPLPLWPSAMRDSLRVPDGNRTTYGNLAVVPAHRGRRVNHATLMLVTSLVTSHRE